MHIKIDFLNLMGKNHIKKLFKNNMLYFLVYCILM